MEKKRIAVVTHTDLDGAGAPVVLRVVFSEYEIIPIYCTYHNIEDKLGELLDFVSSNLDYYEMIFITDISFRQESKLDEKISELNTKVRNYRNFCWFITLLDHHATATWLNKYLWAQVSETGLKGRKECGTAKLFDYLFRTVNHLPQEEKLQRFYNNRLDMFVDLVNEWDTWAWIEEHPEDEPNTLASDLNNVFSFYGRHLFVEEFSKRIATGLVIEENDLFTEADNLILRCKSDEVEKDVAVKDKELVSVTMSYKTRERHVDFISNYLGAQHIYDKDYLLDTNYTKDFNVGVVFLTRNISEVGNKLSELHPELDYIMMINFSSSVPQFSFRTVKEDLEVPLGIIANYVTGKGGGHPKSAGGTMRLTDAIDFLRFILSNKKEY